MHKIQTLPFNNAVQIDSLWLSCVSTCYLRVNNAAKLSYEHLQFKKFFFARARHTHHSPNALTSNYAHGMARYVFFFWCRSPWHGSIHE